MTTVKEALRAFGLAHGLRRRGNRWYRASAETIVVIEPQASNYSDHWYINLGVGIRALHDEHAVPSADLCQIQDRVEPEALEAHAGRVFEGARTLDGVRELLDAGVLKRSYVGHGGWEALSLPVSLPPPPRPDTVLRFEHSGETVGGEPLGRVTIEDADGAVVTWGGLARRVDAVAYAAWYGYTVVG